MAVRYGLMVGVCGLAAWAQSSEKVFYVPHLESQQAIQEVANLVRSVGDFREVALDVPNRSLTLKGTAEQLAFAGWVTAEMDVPGKAPGTREMAFNDARAPLVQIFYLREVDNARDLQEFVNALRAATDIQRCFPMFAQRAIVMRGMPEQVKAADWILGVLDVPAAQRDSAGHDYRLTEPAWDRRSGLLMRVAQVKKLETPQAIQEVINATRSMSDLQRVFPIQSRKMLVMRGSEEQIALANWLIQELDGAPGEGTREFKANGYGDQMTQVAYVKTGTLQDAVSEIRTTTKMQRVYPVNSRGAVTMRGTADQLAQAAVVIAARKGR